MASVEVHLDHAATRVTTYDGQRVVVVSDGTNEVVFVPREGNAWVSVWGLGMAIDRASGEYLRDEQAGMHAEVLP